MVVGHSALVTGYTAATFDLAAAPSRCSPRCRTARAPGGC
ncbi:hypothetical protein SCOCK_10227 [Actinacidiphila cocklensis]|uniref:Uncharacterized protein n=1 Tax=Actinacidiphila cocklensis TaxID=887465 RepID=A0A9W4GPP9_9ACTN|nr:hypothetical protein SCOCK_10227 [Actinacidiphila cocklensis]